MKTTSKILSVLLVLALAIGMMGVVSFAAEEKTTVTFVKKDITEIPDGTQVVIVNRATGNAPAHSELVHHNLPAVPVNAADGKLTAPADAEYVWTLVVDGDKYQFENEGYFLCIMESKGDHPNQLFDNTLWNRENTEWEVTEDGKLKNTQADHDIKTGRVFYSEQHHKDGDDYASPYKEGVDVDFYAAVPAGGETGGETTGSETTGGGESKPTPETGPVEPKTVKVHAQVPADWKNAAVYAWNGAVNNTWPGADMTKHGDWFDGEIAAEMVNVIINNKDGKQTVDLTVEAGKEAWIVLGKAGEDGKFAAAVSYTKPADKEKNPTVKPVTPKKDVISIKLPDGTYYFTGKMQEYKGKPGNFMDTTKDLSKAAEVVKEAKGDGFYLRVKDGKYITIEEYEKDDKTKSRITLTDAPATVYTVNDLGAMVAKVGENEYYLGSYTNKDGKTFTTISASKSSYMNAENVGKTQFAAKVTTVGGESAQTGDNSFVAVVTALAGVSALAVLAINRKKNF